jgi:hypothetical protein
VSVRFYPEADAAQVYGIPGVYWQQHGRYFTRDGQLVEGDPDLDRGIRELKATIADPETPLSDKPELRHQLEEMESRRTSVVRIPEPAAAVAKDDMRVRENKHLKALMEQYGEPWVSVEHAKKWLEGRA